MPHLILILFLFALGACVGSFLNVVVWRLPRDESLISPGSHCPKCNAPLKWYDNIPVLGWIALRGRCRYCKEPISPRYPIVEGACGLLFVFYYVMFFMFQIGPCPEPVLIASGSQTLLYTRPLTIQQDWPIYGLYMFLIAGLLAASLIDADLFIIPIEIPWVAAGVALIAHALMPAATAGKLSIGPLGAAVAMGGGVGLVISIVLFRLGWIHQSFPKGEPLLEFDREQLKQEIEAAQREGKPLGYESELPPEYTRGQIRFEIGKEMMFLLPPMVCAFIAFVVMYSSAQGTIASWLSRAWVSGLLGAILGALVGGFVVWITRILGTLAFGRIAMGLGDVHLMFGVGAVIGAGAATVSFFLAPFFGILVAVYMLLTGTRRELPYGPYLSLATAFVMLFYCPIAAYLTPGLFGVMEIIRSRLGM